MKSERDKVIEELYKLIEEEKATPPTDFVDKHLEGWNNAFSFILEKVKYWSSIPIKNKSSKMKTAVEVYEAVQAAWGGDNKTRVLSDWAIEILNEVQKRILQDLHPTKGCEEAFNSGLYAAVRKILKFKKELSRWPH